MPRTFTHSVHYKMHSADRERLIDVVAGNKEDAWDLAVYERIPEKEGSLPYSAWVASVTYNNGKYKTFNTFEGKPY